MRPQVLKDETTLAESKVSENGFMVIMVTKPKAKAPEAKAPEAAAAPAAVNFPYVLPYCSVLCTAHLQLIQEVH